MSASRFTIFWDIQNEDKWTGTPVRQASRNDLDSHGSVLDLSRIPEEDNVSYYKRLQSVIPLRAGSDREGLIHGITRELGLEEIIGIKISPASLGGSWTAPAPKVEITATQIILYSTYYSSSNYTIDTTVDIFDQSGSYLLSDVITSIQASEYFSAELGPYSTGDEKSNGLFQGSSEIVISKEWVPANKYFVLEHDDVVIGSLNFTEKEIFATEISPSVATPVTSGLTLAWSIITPVSSSGEYHVNYDTGIVTSYLSASGGGTCRYAYRDFPFHVRWSPVVVYNLRDDVYREKVFEDENALDDTTKHGVTTAEGSEVYSQVFSKAACLWGE